MEQNSALILPAPFAWITLPGKGYTIAKYPLTNAQYAKFIEADGYNQRQYWTDAGWEAKLKGFVLDYTLGEAVPTNTPWTEPRHWHDPQFNSPHQPVVGVPWYEAVAFLVLFHQSRLPL